MKTRLLICWLLSLMAMIWSHGVYAQISEGGLPPSFDYPNALRQAKQPFTAPVSFDVEQLKAEDLALESTGVPLRTSMLIPVQLDLLSNGEWTTLPNGQQVLRLTVDAPGAIATMLYYDEFYIPKGGKLFIYNADKSHVLGAYTDKTNPKNRKFATELVAGDQLTLEYVSAIQFTTAENQVFPGDKPRIKISKIGYGYNYLEVYRTKSNLRIGESESCMININCPEGDDWQDQKRGVAKSLTPIRGSGYICSGTILNNTAEDLSPYFLTASHCFYDNAGQKILDTEWDWIVYYFHYETPDCSTTTVPVNAKTMVGAQLLVELPITGGSDGVLLELKDPIPADYNVYYNGWDRSPTAPTSGVGIHHPAGDVKKISTYTTTATSITWNNGEGATDAHWNITWAETQNGKSLTEGGSSGSPIFNQDKRVVGSLTGGPAIQGVPKCDLPDNYKRGYYGKLWYHWDQTVNQMKTYLDKANTGATTLDGTYTGGGVPEARFMASQTEIYALQSITYTDLSGKADTWEWTFQNGTPNSYTGKTPPPITYNTAGTHTTKLVINNATPGESTYTMDIEVTVKGGTAVSPTAQFSLYGQEVMKEGFDAAVPPAGWTIEKPGLSTQQFQMANLNPYWNFNAIDPTSTNSALVVPDANNEVDTWLKSPEYTIPTNARLEFYALYSGASITGGVLSVHVTTNNWSSSDEIWTNGPDNTAIDDFIWYRNEVDLADYAGQNIKLGFRYKGQDGNYAGFDGIKITVPIAPTTSKTIETGDFITPIEYSIGPAVLWEWTFEGGTPATSTEREPTVQYNTAGTYDITLKVTNTAGTNTHIFADAVIVGAPAPVASFEAEGGYTRQSNYGLFLPTGGAANFYDTSTKNPTTWEWTFEGATPPSSTDQHPQGITYATAGEFDVSLKATNLNGNNEFSITNLVKAGYDVPEKIWNMEKGEPVNEYYTFTYGYVTGTNDYYITSYSERFEAPLDAGVVSKVDIGFKVVSATSGSLNVSVYTDNGGYPGTELQTVALPVTGISTSGYTTVTFPEPVVVSGAYHIVVDGFYTSSYEIAILSSEIRESGGKNTAYLYDDYYGKWYSFDKYTLFSSPSLSLNIVPEFTYKRFDLDIEGDYAFNKKNIDPAASTVTIKSNAEWTVTALNPWIKVTNGGPQTGDGSFTFTVDDNPYLARKGLIKVSIGSIVEKYVVVQQAGTQPTDLVATVIDEENGIVELNWEHNIGSYIFDDIESHTAFALNSPGAVGWSYIDGDGDVTYGYGNYLYPNYKEPMAFQVFNGTSLNSSGIAKSGNQIFACFASYNVPNDDWLISPELSFEEDFTFSFWAKSFYDNSYTEVIDVVYSTTGNSAADFTNVLATENITSPDTWLSYQYTIPANAKYVAIHCKSYDQYILMVDDIFIGLGSSPQSAYVTNPTLNANIFGDPSSLAKTRTPSAINDMPSSRQQKLKAGKPGAGQPIIITNGVTGETFEVTIKAPASSGNKLEASNNNNALVLPATKEQRVLRAATAPVSEKEIGYTTGVPSGNAIGLEAGGDIEVAIRFTPTDLIALHNTKLKSVDVYLGAEPVDGITLNIRSGNDIIHSQRVSSPAINEFVRIDLNQEVRIDAGKDLYIGYAYTQKPKVGDVNNYVAATDAGPAVIGKGDLISLSGGKFESIGGMGLNYNWLITALVEDQGIDYQIYRNGELIGTTDQLTYTDETATTVETCYQVSARYHGELESTLSNEDCVTIWANKQYTITLPDPQTGYSIVKDDESEFDPADLIIFHGKPFAFRIILEEGYTQSVPVVKVNGVELQAVDGLYTITRVTDNIEITVEDVKLNTYTVILPKTDGVRYRVDEAFQQYMLRADMLIEEGTFKIPHGTEFRFAIELLSGYTDSEPVVTAGGQTILPDGNGIYAVTVTANVEVKLNKVKLNIYTVKLPQVTGLTYDRPAGDYTVQHGAKFTFSITKRSAYEQSVLEVTASNGVTVRLIDPVKNRYEATVTRDTEILIEGVKLNVYTVTIDGADGTIVFPESGEHRVEIWQDFDFFIRLLNEYSHSTPVVKVNGEELPYNTFKDVMGGEYHYLVKSITNDIHITFEGIKRNTVGIEDANATLAKVWTTPGYIHIRQYAERRMEHGVRIYTVAGQLVATPIADSQQSTVTCKVPAGNYIVVVDGETFKVVVK